MAAQSVEQGGDSLLALTNHHPKTSEASTQHFHRPSEHPRPWRAAAHCFEAFDNAQGRRVRRRVWTMPDGASLPALEQWPGLQTVMAVEPLWMAHTQAPVTRESRCDLASLRRSADALVRMMRQPGAIENTWHGS